MKTKMFPLDELLPAPYQPSGRATPLNTRELRESLDEYGQIEPAYIYKDNSKWHIAAGHRRKFALQMLGRTEMECVVISKEEAPGYFHATNTGKSLTTREAQINYRTYPEALSPVQRRNVERAINTIGEELFDQIVKEDRMAAVTISSETKTAITAIGSTDPDFVAVKYSSEDIARAVYALGTKHVLAIRRNDSWDLPRKGREYKKKLLPHLPRRRLRKKKDDA
jgi:hypothetical protein